jgi:hypothetical protein
MKKGNKKMMRKTQTNISIALALAAASILSAQPAQADDFIKGGQETFTLNLGGIVNQFDSSFRLDGASTKGTQVNLEGSGLKDNLSSFEASGTWRITERNRVDFLYFGTDRSGSRTSTQDITVKGDTIPAGSTVSAESQTDYLLFDYRYSFYKSDAWEFAGMLGFYGGKFDFTVKGPGVLVGTTVNVSESTSVPLPLIGLSADWYLQPRWKISSSLSGMAANIGDVDGDITVFTLGTDYMFTRNLGLGMSYMYSKINVDVAKSDFNGNIDFTNNAVLLYATMKF